MSFAITVACAQKSPRQEAHGMTDGAHITVDYGAPSVKARVIWGELVPFPCRSHLLQVERYFPERFSGIVPEYGSFLC